MSASWPWTVKTGEGWICTEAFAWLCAHPGEPIFPETGVGKRLAPDLRDFASTRFAAAEDPGHHGNESRVSHRVARLCAWLAPRARRRGKLSHRSSSLIRPGFLSNQTGPALVHNGSSWVSWSGGPLPVYSVGLLDNRNIELVRNANLSTLVGTQVYVGYGLDENDMLTNGKYGLVYSVTAAIPLSVTKLNSTTIDFSGYGTAGKTSYFLRSILIADLNSDGKNEFVFSMSPYPQVLVPLKVIGDEGGTLDLTSKYFPNGAPTVMHSPFILYEDINGDGKKDIIAAEAGLDVPPWTGSKIGVALSNGSTFQNVSNLIPDTAFRNYAVTIGNFNGDAKIDILVPMLSTSGVGSTSLLNYSNGNFLMLPNAIDFMSQYLYSHTSLTTRDFNSDGYDDLLLSGNWVGRTNTIVYGGPKGLDIATLNKLPMGPFGQGGYDYGLVYNPNLPPPSIINSAEVNSIAFDFNHDGKPDIFSTSQRWIHYQPGIITDKNSTSYSAIYANGGDDFLDTEYSTLTNVDGRNFESIFPVNRNMGYRFYFTLTPYDINKDGNNDVIGYYHTVSRVGDIGSHLWGTTFFLNDGIGNFTPVDAKSIFPQLTVAPYLPVGSSLVQYSVGKGFIVDAAGSVSSDSLEVISGAQSIIGSYFGKSSYTPYLHTDASVIKLTPNQTYQVTFKYKILTTSSNGFECLFYSPTGGSAGNFLSSTTITGSVGETGIIKLTSTLGAYSDYQVLWNVVGTGAIAVDEIQIINFSSGDLMGSENAEQGVKVPYTWIDLGAVMPISDDGNIFSGLQLLSAANQTGEYSVQAFTSASLSSLAPYPIVINDRQKSVSIATKSLNDMIYEIGASLSLTKIDGGAGIDTCVYVGKALDNLNTHQVCW